MGLVALGLLVLRKRSPATIEAKLVPPPISSPEVASVPTIGSGQDKPRDTEVKSQAVGLTKELTWRTIPRILRFRNPMATAEGLTMGVEERLLYEEGLGREGVEAHRKFINSIDRKLDEAFGVLPFWVGRGVGGDKGGPAAQMKLLMSAAAGEESIEGVDPAALRVRALCRMACYDRDEAAVSVLNSLSGSDPDPDVKVAAAVTLAIWKETSTASIWISAQQDPELLAAFVEGLQYAKVGHAHLGGHRFRERLMPRYSEDLAASLVDLRGRLTDPMARMRALDVLGHCAYGGRSVAAIDELFNEAAAPATIQSQAVAFRGLSNCVESDRVRSRLMEWSNGQDARLAGHSIWTLGTNLHADSLAYLGGLIGLSSGDRAKSIVRALQEAWGPMAAAALSHLDRTSAEHHDEAIRKLASESAITIRKREKID